MFKKPFKVKSNIRLKSTDVKKLKLLILKQFPSLSDESLSALIPNKEVLLSVKIVTHSDDIVIVYCVQKLPVVFEIDEIMYPTVYMLFYFPDLLPSFTTHTQVFAAISSGADLMLPGVVLPGVVLPGEVNIKSYGKLDKGARVSVNLTSNKAPIAVGKTALSSFDMYMSAKRGKCVNILHFFGDSLSNYGSTLPVPDLGPVNLCEQSNESDEKLIDTLKTVEDLTLSENNDGDVSQNIIKQNSVETENSSLIIDVEGESSALEDVAEKNCESENTEDVDELLMYCFLKALKTTVKKSSFPLLASSFYKKHILAACPPGKYIDIKKTKYKKFSNFLNEVAETNIINLDMMSKGVQSISNVVFDHVLLKEFDNKYFSLEQLANSSEDRQLVVSSNKHVAPEIREKYAVTAAVLPLFSIYLNKKGDSLTTESIRKCIADYVRVQNLKDEENKKLVKLDKILKDIVGGNSESVTWDVLINGVVRKMGHAYELSAGEKKVPTTVKGKLQPIDIQVGTRVGNKKVSLISNLELYGINVTEFAHECQHGVGASTTINNVPGAKSLQVQIQGNQVIFVNKLLTEKYNIQKRFIRGLENAPKRKK